MIKLQGIFSIVLLWGLLGTGCTTQPAKSPEAHPQSDEVKPASIPEIIAEQIASDGSWGNTEGPAIDSKGNLYFCSRGTYKGIVRWNDKEGARRYLAVATKAGPGSLWLDDNDNIFVTATDERRILKVTPNKKVTTIAHGFEKDANLAKGPNDLVVASNGTVYFTDPKGYFVRLPTERSTELILAAKRRYSATRLRGQTG